MVPCFRFCQTSLTKCTEKKLHEHEVFFGSKVKHRLALVVTIEGPIPTHVTASDTYSEKLSEHEDLLRTINLFSKAS